jgi:glycosyltransferase involved in cell wall biosynthesis
MAVVVAQQPDNLSAHRVLALLQRKEGSLTELRTTLRQIAFASGSPQDQRALENVVGTMRELDPAWLPDIPGQAAATHDNCSMRVCHLFKVAYPYENSGGAIRNLNIVRSQRELGIDPYVVTPLGYPRPDTTDGGIQAATGGVPHVLIGRRYTDADSLPVDRRLELDAHETAAVLRSRGADIIHAASGLRGYELALKAIALGRHFQLPVVYEVRSLHEHLWGSPRLQNKLEREWTRLRMAQEDRCMREVDAVVTIADAMRDVLVARGVPQDKITVVPNGVDTASWVPRSADPVERRRLGLRSDPVLGYISNMSYREGHDILLIAMSRLIAQGIEVSCLLVGDGPERRQLEELSAKLGIREHVVFTGEVDHASIADYYAAIDIFVVPRRPDYAADYVTPLKPFEAMAMERALVCSDLPALREIVGTDRGKLFRTDSLDSLASTLSQLLAAPDERQRLGAVGRAWVIKERSWKRNAERYLELYDDLLTRRRTRRS